ncbi:hypothetical protein IX51_04630 [uncultured archaeon]|nr:hypothetical protein IX51_04630 [uncultured archaeon]
MWKTSATKEPYPEAIRAAGPSFPPLPPVPMVTADDRSFTLGIWGLILVLLWTAAIAASVPWPSVSGANRYTVKAEIRPPATVETGINSLP